MTQDILQEELEKFVLKAKNGTFINSEKTTMQHTDFENLEHLIQMALAFGKLKEKQVRTKRECQ